jgi:hypothetical protein
MLVYRDRTTSGDGIIHKLKIILKGEDEVETGTIKEFTWRTE